MGTVAYEKDIKLTTHDNNTYMLAANAASLTIDNATIDDTNYTDNGSTKKIYGLTSFEINCSILSNFDASVFSVLQSNINQKGLTINSELAQTNSDYNSLTNNELETQIKANYEIGNTSYIAYCKLTNYTRSGDITSQDITDLTFQNQGAFK